jgi:uncharacterized protein (DUF4415 family)
MPEITAEDIARYDAIRDEDIDTSDMPVVTDFSNSWRWKDREMYKPVKRSITCKLDADVIAWLKVKGRGYQTRMNSILRKAMLQSLSETAPGKTG